MSDEAPGELTEAQRQALAAGRHAEVADELRASGRPAQAAALLEQIWDFAAAMDAYVEAGRPVDALRMALEAAHEGRIATCLTALETGDEASLDAAIELLQARRRDMDAARLLAIRSGDPDAQAQARQRAGDLVGAAEVLRDAGRLREALDVLRDDRVPTSPRGLALAAELCWLLGDAEGAARYAQRRMRTGEDDPATAALLARALGSLGHDLAAQLVLERSGASPSDEALPGRYRVTGVQAGGIVGAAYVGFDRLTLQEVELHLLLADQQDLGPVDPMVAAAIDRFATAATKGAAIGHPAIRPIIRIEPAAGLLVLPRAEGPTLRTMIRPPGLMDISPARARALAAFILEGIAAAHERALPHGWLLPSQIVTDPLGRPLVPPFGIGQLAGLAATRTGALEELMAFTAPELRRGGEATIAGDLFAVGALLWALLRGRLPTHADELDDEAESPVLALARAMMAPDPDQRPDATTALQRLRAPVADLHQLERDAAAVASAGRSSSQAAIVQLADGVEVTVDDSWDEETLAALCHTCNPWWQPILDRVDRTLILAPWPEGSAALDPADADWRDLVPAEALGGPPEVRAALQARLSPSSLVVTPSRVVMLALDDVLTR